MKKILILSSVAASCLLSGCNSYTFSGNEIKINNLNESHSSIKAKEVTRSNIKEDIENKEYVLENVEYSFPTLVKDLQDNGWVVEDNSTRTLKSGDKIASMLLKNDYKEILISVENNSSRSKAIDKCEVNGILVQELDGNYVDIDIFNGISIGSTKKEVEEVVSKYDVEIRESDEVINYIINQNEHVTSIVVNRACETVFSIFLSEIN